MTTDNGVIRAAQTLADSIDRVADAIILAVGVLSQGDPDEDEERDDLR